MKILFMCVANSARSQLAEGLAKHLYQGVTIESAGSAPSKVNPLAIRAMKEVGIDLTKHHSKSVDTLSPDFVDNLDYVITLCAEEVCPAVITRAKRLHWPHPDPAGQTGSEEEQLSRFRDTREAIKKKLKAFAAEKGIKLASTL